eukprot:63959-Pleurochrysis_carterae.AAC.4
MTDLQPSPHLPQFVDSSHAIDATMLLQEQSDGCVAALQMVGDDPGTIRQGEAAWHRYWVPLTGLLGVLPWELRKPVGTGRHLHGGPHSLQGPAPHRFEHAPALESLSRAKAGLRLQHSATSSP